MKEFARIRVLLDAVSARLAILRQHLESGNATVEWVLLVGVAAALATTAGGIVTGKVVQAAKNLLP